MFAVIATLKVLIVYWALYFFINRMMTARPHHFVVVMRLIGMLCFALIPLWVIRITNGETSFAFIQSQYLAPFIYSLLIGLPVIIISNFYVSKQEKHQAAYPAIRANEWDTELIVMNVVSWALYLMAYEFLFRGFLLFACIDVWGMIPAIGINVVLYALAHLPKGRFETIGAIPLGFVFCAIAIYTHTFWSVFVLHWVMACSGDLFCVWRNPAMHFRFNK